MSWFVYALYNSLANKVYIGQTNDIERRTREHNEKRGRHFTAQFKGKWKIIYQEELETKREALKREKQLKSFQGRQSVKNLIKIQDFAPL